MIVVLGFGRETRAWLERHAHTSVDQILVLDETPDDTLAAGPWEHARVDLDDTSSVQEALAGRVVTDVVRSPGVSPYRAGASWLAAQAPTATPTGRWLADSAPDDLVAITGTKGKSTVAAMTARMVSAGSETSRTATQAAASSDAGRFISSVSVLPILGLPCPATRSGF